MSAPLTPEDIEALVARFDVVDEHECDTCCALIRDVRTALDSLSRQLAEARAERDDFFGQLALREPTALERDMQEIMRINNELLARAEAAEAALAEALAERDGFRKQLMKYVARALPLKEQGEP